MKKTSLQSLIGLVIMGGVALLSPLYARATVLYEQLDDTATHGQYFPGTFNTGYPFSGATDVYIKVENSNNTAIIFWDFAGGDCSATDHVVNFGHVTTANTPEILHASISSATTIGCNATNMYFYPSSGTLTIYGSAGAFAPYVVIADSPVNNSTSTHITSFTPANGATTTVGTINFQVQSYINSDDLDALLSGTQIFLSTHITGYDNAVGTVVYDLPFTDFGASTTDFSFTLPSGLYGQTTSLVVGHLDDTGHLVRDDWPLDVYSSSFVVGSSYVVGNFDYNPNGIFATTTTTSLGSCSDSQGSIIYVLCRVFYPSASTWNGLQGLGDLMLRKPPAGYFTQIKNALLTASSTASSTIGAFSVIPTGVLNNLFTPLKTAVASILWFFFLVHFFHRLRNIEL